MIISIEEHLRKFLKSHVDVPVHVGIPRNRPDDFVSLSRAGGASDFVRDFPLVAIKCWGKTRLAAERLSLQVNELLIEYAYENGINISKSNSMYHDPDPDSGAERYHITAEFITSF